MHKMETKDVVENKYPAAAAAAAAAAEEEEAAAAAADAVMHAVP